MPLRDVTIWSYELRERVPPPPARPPAEPLAVVRAEIASPELARFLYTSVGGDWHWIDRLTWTYEDWLRWLARETLQTWVGYVRGTPVGYFQLERQAPDSVEIAFFGLIPAFTGRRLGAAMLTAAIGHAWEFESPTRVWLHTCSLDHPHARANYEARGFRLFRTEHVPVRLPDEPPGPWPGARRPRAA